MKRMLWISLLLALMLPALGSAVEENVVVPLPTVAPAVSVTVTNVPDYSSDTLAGYYSEEPMGAWQQFPALTAAEQRRATELLAQYQDGARPEDNMLNLETAVQVGVYALKSDDYSGESAFVLLPNRGLTDDEILAVIDAYAQLGLSFDPAGLSYRNCMRGGGIECTRFRTEEERERASVLDELYLRQSLRPQVAFTPLPDDGVGRIQLEPDAYNGLDSFAFYPHRSMTDEELLQLIDASTSAEASSISPSEYSDYETQTRSELQRIFAAPIALTRGSEAIDMGSNYSVYLDDSTVYGVEFSLAASGTEFTGFFSLLHTETGAMAQCWTYVDTAGLRFSDLHADPYDPKWQDIAREYVESWRTDGMEIASIETRGEARLQDIGYGVWMAVTMEDGCYYELAIAFQNERLANASYSEKAPIYNANIYE